MSSTHTFLLVEKPGYEAKQVVLYSLNALLKGAYYSPISFDLVTRMQDLATLPAPSSAAALGGTVHSGEPASCRLLTWDPHAIAIEALASINVHTCTSDVRSTWGQKEAHCGGDLYG